MTGNGEITFCNIILLNIPTGCKYLWLVAISNRSFLSILVLVVKRRNRLLQSQLPWTCFTRAHLVTAIHIQFHGFWFLFFSLNHQAALRFSKKLKRNLKPSNTKRDDVWSSKWCLLLHGKIAINPHGSDMVFYWVLHEQKQTTAIFIVESQVMKSSLRPIWLMSTFAVRWIQVCKWYVILRNHSECRSTFVTTDK